VTDRVPPVKGHRLTLENTVVVVDGFHEAGTSWFASCECGWEQSYITAERWARKMHRNHRMEVIAELARAEVPRG
jgi:hypothetical protein